MLQFELFSVTSLIKILPYIRKNRSLCSEFSAGYLYMWNKDTDVRFCLWNETLSICETIGEQIAFSYPIGAGTTWIAGTMNRDAFERALALEPGEVMPCVSPIGYPAKKMSLRETMMRKGVKADSRYGFEELFFDGGFETPLTEEKAGALKDVLEAVRLAPSAVNKQPWRVVVCGEKAHFYEKRSKGYVSADGWDIQKIDMGIALCHFELIAKERGLDAAFEIADPGSPVGGDTHYIASYVLK